MTELKVGKAVVVAGTVVPVTRLLAPNAGPMTGPGTNTYLVGSRELALIDPGPADDRHVAAIQAAISHRTLRWIFVTHTHADHSPGAAMLARQTGAELVGIPAPEGGHHDYSFAPTREYRHGEVIGDGEFSMELVHTPGHVSNHFCYLLREENLLFTGDHILQGTTSVILPPDGDMADYLQSLNLLLEYPLDYLAPGHGSLIPHPQVAIRDLLAHRMRRENKILHAMPLNKEVATEELTRLVYDDVAPHLLPWARKTLEAHLIKLKGESRVTENGDGWILKS